MILAVSKTFKQMELFERYCTTYLSRVAHPFGGQQAIEFGRAGLERAIACVRLVLATPVQEPRLSGLNDRFLDAFRAYIQTPRDQEGALLNAVEKLAQLVEPYLKKLVLLFYGTRTIQQGTSSRPLWYLGTEQILRELGLTTCNLKERQDSYWAKQPAEAGIWRIAYVSRHKGTHEAHTLDLPSLERTAVAVTTAFLVAARHAISDPQSSAGTHQHLQDALRFRELLRVRADTYHVTGELPTTIEHVRLYNVRQYITLDDNQAQLLFRSYCAGRGSVFYFLQDRSREELVRWAYEFSGDTEASVARGATAFLLASGEYVKLRRIVELFNDYRSRFRLAYYIDQRASRQDLDTLWSLILRHRSPLVREVAVETFARLATKSDHDWLKRTLATSSPRAHSLFPTWAVRMSEETSLNIYRRNLVGRHWHLRALAAICLGVVGRLEDITLLENATKSARDRATRVFATVGLGMASARNGKTALVQKLLNRQRLSISRLCVLGIGLLQNKSLLKQLLRVFNRLPLEVAGALRQTACRELHKTARQLLVKANSDDIRRVLVLALCRSAQSKDFSFLVKFLAVQKEPIYWDHYELMNEIALIARLDRASRKLLRNWMDKKEFWYYYGSNRPKDRLPVAQYDNLVFMRGVLGLSFGEVAQEKDVSRLRRMLRHNYWAVNRGGANGLVRVGRVEDMDEIIRRVAATGKVSDGELGAVIGMDIALYCTVPGIREDFLRFGPLAMVD